MNQRPFWEGRYADLDAPDTFGDPSPEIGELVELLPEGARVLDLGCGEGRNTIPLLAAGMDVTAVDRSEAGIRKLIYRSEQIDRPVTAVVADLEGYPLVGEYDLVIAHGVVHLLQPADRDGLISRMKLYTRAGGYNVVAVFTTALPAPPDLEEMMVGLFEEGEIFERYRDWEIILERSYILNDEHDGGIRHSHPINKVVARKPTGAA